MMKFIKFLALIGAFLWAAPAFSQSVQQSGSVTPGHAVKWITNGVVGDAGTAQSGSLSSLGVTNNGGPGICINSAAITGPYNQTCFATTTNGGTKISSYAYGGATGAGIVFDINGSTQGFPAVTLPVTVNDLACFGTITGTLKDCSIPSNAVSITPWLITGLQPDLGANPQQLSFYGGRASIGSNKPSAYLTLSAATTVDVTAVGLNGIDATPAPPAPGTSLQYYMIAKADGTGTGILTSRATGYGSVTYSAAGAGYSAAYARKLNNAFVWGAGCANDGTTQASFTGAISGTTLTVSGVTGTIVANQFLSGTGVTANTYIVSGSGTTWTVNNSQTVGSESMTTTNAALPSYNLAGGPVQPTTLFTDYGNDGACPFNYTAVSNQTYATFTSISLSQFLPDAARWAKVLIYAKATSNTGGHAWCKAPGSTNGGIQINVPGIPSYWTPPVALDIITSSAQAIVCKTDTGIYITVIVAGFVTLERS